MIKIDCSIVAWASGSYLEPVSQIIYLDNLFESVTNDIFEGFSFPIRAIVDNTSHIYNLGIDLDMSISSSSNVNESMD